MVNVLTLDSHFLHWLRGQKSSDLGNDRAIETLNDDCVLDFEDTIYEGNINGGTETFNNFDFEDCALKIISLLQLSRNSLLACLRQIGHQIGKTLTSNGRGWDQTDVLFSVGILPIWAHIKTFLSKFKNNGVHSLLEFVLGVGSLNSKRISEISIIFRFPLVASVDLVQGNDEWTFLLSKQLYGLTGLLFQSVH